MNQINKVVTMSTNNNNKNNNNKRNRKEISFEMVNKKENKQFRIENLYRKRMKFTQRNKNYDYNQLIMNNMIKQNKFELQKTMSKIVNEHKLPNKLLSQNELYYITKKLISDGSRNELSDLANKNKLTALKGSDLLHQERLRQNVSLSFAFAPDNRFRYGYALDQRHLKTLPVTAAINIFQTGFTINSSQFMFYDAKFLEFFKAIDAGRLPPASCNLLKSMPIQYFEGCIVVEIKDYRYVTSTSTGPTVHRVLLQPTNESINHDVIDICRRLKSKLPNEKLKELPLKLEGAMLKAIHPKLCLDPSIVVHQLANLVQYNNNQFYYPSLTRAQMLSRMKPERDHDKSIPERRMLTVQEIDKKYEQQHKDSVVWTDRAYGHGSFVSPLQVLGKETETPVKLDENKLNKILMENKEQQEKRKKEIEESKIVAQQSTVMSSVQTNNQQATDKNLDATTTTKKKPFVTFDELTTKNKDINTELLKFANYVYSTKQNKINAAHDCLVFDPTMRRSIFNPKPFKPMNVPQEQFRITINSDGSELRRHTPDQIHQQSIARKNASVSHRYTVNDYKQHLTSLQTKMAQLQNAINHERDELKRRDYINKMDHFKREAFSVQQYLRRMHYN